MRSIGVGKKRRRINYEKHHFYYGIFSRASVNYYREDYLEPMRFTVDSMHSSVFRVTVPSARVEETNEVPKGYYSDGCI